MVCMGRSARISRATHRRARAGENNDCADRAEEARYCTGVIPGGGPKGRSRGIAIVLVEGPASLSGRSRFLDYGLRPSLGMTARLCIPGIVARGRWELRFGG